MEQFFSILFSSISGSTMFIYLLLLVFSSLFAQASQPAKFYGTPLINKTAYYLTFVILWGALAFADNGYDTDWYMSFFTSKNNFKDCEYGSVELGFQYYNVLIHYITDNSTLFVIISRTIMIVFVFRAIYLLRNKSIIWLSVLGFVAVIYFQMFSALRNSMAYSMSFLVYAYCVKKKYILALLFALIGVSFHRSMILFVGPLFMYILTIKLSPKFFLRLLIPLLIALVVVIYLYGTSILQYFLAFDDTLMNKYDGYFEGETTQGFMILVVYFPLLYVFYNYKYLIEQDRDLFYLNIFISILGFAIALLAYQIGQLTRVAPYYAFPHLFYIGYYIHKVMIEKHKKPNCIKLYLTFMSVYWFYRFTAFISGLFYSNGLDRYGFFTLN